jgi:hypothetical protein
MSEEERRSRRVPGRAKVQAMSARSEALSRRGREWADRHEPASAKGVAIHAWRSYQALEGPLQSALLSLYSSSPYSPRCS